MNNVDPNLKTAVGRWPRVWKRRTDAWLKALDLPRGRVRDTEVAKSVAGLLWMRLGAKYVGLMKAGLSAGSASIACSPYSEQVTTLTANLDAEEAALRREAGQ